MFKQAISALVLIVASSNGSATNYYDYDYEDQVDVQEYIVKERHLNNWNDEERIEHRHRHDRWPPVGRSAHRWGPPGHVRRVFREYCPPPRRVFRSHFIERVESPYFDFRIRYQNH